MHLNRQSGMIFACSLFIFDVISSVVGSHFFQFCHDYWFNAHAMTIGSVVIDKFRGHLTEG